MRWVLRVVGAPIHYTGTLPRMTAFAADLIERGYSVTITGSDDEHSGLELRPQRDVVPFGPKRHPWELSVRNILTHRSNT